MRVLCKCMVAVAFGLMKKIYFNLEENHDDGVEMSLMKGNHFVSLVKMMNCLDVMKNNVYNEGNSGINVTVEVFLCHLMM